MGVIAVVGGVLILALAAVLLRQANVISETAMWLALGLALTLAGILSWQAESIA